MASCKRVVLPWYRHVLTLAIGAARNKQAAETAVIAPRLS